MRRSLLLSLLRLIPWRWRFSLAALWLLKELKSLTDNQRLANWLITALGRVLVLCEPAADSSLLTFDEMLPSKLCGLVPALHSKEAGFLVFAPSVIDGEIEFAYSLAAGCVSDLWGCC